MATFRERLSRLGHATYAQYLASDHWARFKARYRESGSPLACRVCGGGRVQLHHRTYRRLGQERNADVVPLCREHHVAVHEWLSERNACVSRTGEAVAFLKGDPAGERPKKRRARHKADQFFTRDEARKVVVILSRVGLKKRHKKSLAAFAGRVPNSATPPGYLTNELYAMLAKQLNRLQREGKPKAGG